jgi:hypothetical protein
VLVHHDDRAAAVRKGATPLYPLRKPPVLYLVGHFLRNGVARTAPVAEASGGVRGGRDHPGLAPTHARTRPLILQRH